MNKNHKINHYGRRWRRRSQHNGKKLTTNTVNTSALTGELVHLKQRAGENRQLSDTSRYIALQKAREVNPQKKETYNRLLENGVQYGEGGIQLDEAGNEVLTAETVLQFTIGTLVDKLKTAPTSNIVDFGDRVLGNNEPLEKAAADSGIIKPSDEAVAFVLYLYNTAKGAGMLKVTDKAGEDYRLDDHVAMWSIMVAENELK